MPDIAFCADLQPLVFLCGYCVGTIKVLSGYYQSTIGVLYDLFLSHVDNFNSVVGAFGELEVCVAGFHSALE